MSGHVKLMSARQDINNAKLAAIAVYSDQVPAFLRMFELCSGD